MTRSLKVRFEMFVDKHNSAVAFWVCGGALVTGAILALWHRF